MPIEIRELVIRTQIVDSEIRNPGGKEQTRPNEKEIIERCVEKVIRKLNKKPER